VFLVLPVSLVFPVFPDFLVPSVRVPDTPREYIASAPRAVAVTPRDHGVSPKSWL
jgi:hypothetical protein